MRLIPVRPIGSCMMKMTDNYIVSFYNYKVMNDLHWVMTHLTNNYNLRLL